MSDAERIIGAPAHHQGPVSDPRHLAPWNGGEELVSWQSLHERLEGKQIAGVYWLKNELPLGWKGIGFELTTSEVMVAEAVPTVDRGFRARLLIRWLVRQQIWTPGMQRRYLYGEGRASHLECELCQRIRPQRCPGHQVQGEVVRGVIAPQEPTPTGGDLWIFEFQSGLAMRLLAEPDPDRWYDAALDLQVLHQQRTQFDLGRPA